LNLNLKTVHVLNEDCEHEWTWPPQYLKSIQITHNVGTVPICRTYLTLHCLVPLSPGLLGHITLPYLTVMTLKAMKYHY